MSFRVRLAAPRRTEDGNLALPLASGFRHIFASGDRCYCAMDNDCPDQERDVRERIASLIRSTERAPATPVSGAELRKLKAAVTRLEEMLKAAVDADLQALKSAAARLDQMLANIGKGKDVTGDLKRRDGSQRR